MKETGIVRRIDELGRVVIPKEIRRTMRIKEGDPLEIFTEQDRLFLRKFSPLARMDDISKTVVESLNALTEMTAIVSDTDRVLAAKGARAKEFLSKDISRELQKTIDERSIKSFDEATGKLIITKDGDSFLSETVVPIVSEGDVLGSVILGSDRGGAIDGVRVKLASLAADLIARQF